MEAPETQRRAAIGALWNQLISEAAPGAIRDGVMDGERGSGTLSGDEPGKLETRLI